MVDVSEVGDGSAPQSDGSEVDWQARFNGLMGRFNRTQNEFKALQDRLAELEQTSQPAHETSEEQPVADNDAITQLQEQVSALTQLLTQGEMKKAQATILDKYPEVKPLAHLIVGADTPEAFEEVAKSLSDALKSAGTDAPATDAGDTTAPAADAAAGAGEGAAAEGTAPVTAPVTAGGTTFDGQAASQEKVTEAISNGSWSDYLRAKSEVAEQDPANAVLG